MPLVDMPLAELKTYAGRNPRPADFDAHWDAALAELDRLDPQATLVPAAFQAPNAECFDLYFKGVGQTDGRVHAKYLRPAKADGPVPCILVFHGYTGDSGSWHDKLAYVNMGFAVAALDCRGQGGLSDDDGTVLGTTYTGHIIRGIDDAPEKMLFRQIFLDTAELARVIASFREIDESRIGALGGSQGGALTVACAALAPDIVKRAAPAFPFLSDYRRVWEMDLAKHAYDELKWYFRRYDPRHEREDAIFERLGYIDVQNLAGRIKASILWGTGLMDEVCPPSTQFAAYNKITSQKEMMIYPDFGHEGLPGFDDAVYRFMAGLAE